MEVDAGAADLSAWAKDDLTARLLGCRVADDGTSAKVTAIRAIEGSASTLLGAGGRRFFEYSFALDWTATVGRRRPDHV